MMRINDDRGNKYTLLLQKFWLLYSPLEDGIWNVFWEALRYILVTKPIAMVVVLIRQIRVDFYDHQ